MPTLELRNVADKDALMNSISICNEKLESAIKELSELGESPKPVSPQFKKSLVQRLKMVLNGLQS
jgi:hypothetical protein